MLYFHYRTRLYFFILHLCDNLSYKLVTSDNQSNSVVGGTLREREVAASEPFIFTLISLVNKSENIVAARSVSRGNVFVCFFSGMNELYSDLSPTTSH